MVVDTQNNFTMHIVAYQIQRDIFHTLETYKVEKSRLNWVKQDTFFFFFCKINITVFCS